MGLLTNLGILLLLGCVSHQLASISCNRTPTPRWRGSGRGQHRDKPTPKASRPSLKGKMTTRDGAECRWAATGRDAGVVVLAVACRRGGASFGCEYEARTSACPRYASEPRLYWRQVARALRRQRGLCRDRQVPIRVALCPEKGAHFRLRGGPRRAAVPRSTLAPRPDLGGVTACTRKNKERAEGFCHESWSSFCLFFFTMVQSEDC